MGRPRKSIAALKKTGSYRPGKHAERERETTIPVETPAGSSADRSVQVLHAMPVPPEGLSEVARRHWDVLLPTIAARVRAEDAKNLADMCQWYADLDMLRKALANLDPVKDGVEHARVLRSAVAIGAAAAKIAAGFGLNPKDRARLPLDQETGPRTAKVPVRPKTKLDLQGPPK